MKIKIAFKPINRPLNSAKCGNSDINKNNDVTMLPIRTI